MEALITKDLKDISNIYVLCEHENTPVLNEGRMKVGCCVCKSECVELTGILFLRMVEDF